jgi:hypothetical protein
MKLASREPSVPPHSHAFPAGLAVALIGVAPLGCSSNAATSGSDAGAMLDAAPVRGRVEAGNSSMDARVVRAPESGDSRPDAGETPDAGTDAHTHGDAGGPAGNDAGLPEKTIIGTNDGSGWGEDPAATITGGHITWDRVEVGGGYTVAQAVGFGFHVLAIVNNPDDCTPLSQIDPATWGQGVVTQIQANPGIRLAEAGNEMYLKGTSGNGCAGSTGYGDPQQYGAMYLAAVKAMSAAGLDIPLLFNLTGDYDTASGWSQDAIHGGWLRDAVEATPGLGAAILANGVTTHPYGAVGENTADYAGTAAVAAQEVVAQAVLGGVPVFYITEFGYDMSICGQSAGACSQQDQASKMQAAYEVFLADPRIRGIWWYQSHDDGTGQFGYMNNDNSTRSSFTTISTFGLAQGQ